MSEYIDREAVLREVCHACNDQFDEDPCEPKECSFRELIKALPAADVVPVRNGRWKLDVLDGVPGFRPTAIVCSECLQIGFFETRFCPNCGADMRGAE